MLTEPAETDIVEVVGLLQEKQRTEVTGQRSKVRGQKSESTQLFMTSDLCLCLFFYRLELGARAGAFHQLHRHAHPATASHDLNLDSVAHLVFVE